jgi:hypothetical protein
MNYVLVKYHDHYAILNDDADFIVGRASPSNGQQGPFRVTADLAPDWESDDVAVVQSLDDAIPALAAYYERNPPRWQRESATKYANFTQFAILWVEQDEQGHWRAKRDEYPLMRNGEPAFFATCGEAQSAADAHLLDYYPGVEAIDDGLSWDPDPEIDWRSCPHRVEARAHFEQVTARCCVTAMLQAPKARTEPAVPWRG